LVDKTIIVKEKLFKEVEKKNNINEKPIVGNVQFHTN